MIKRIKTPYQYLQEIREAGQRASKIDKEVVGYFFGFEDSDSFTITEKINLPLLQPGLQKEGISRNDTVIYCLNFPTRMYGLAKDLYSCWRTKRDDGSVMSSGTFHSHPERGGSWSRPDREILGFKILYQTYWDVFEALYGNDEAVIEIVGDNGNLAENIDRERAYNVCMELIGEEPKTGASLSFDLSFSGDFYGQIQSRIQEKIAGYDFLPSPSHIQHVEVKRDDGVIVLKY